MKEMESYMLKKLDGESDIIWEQVAEGAWRAELTHLKDWWVDKRPR